MKAISIEEKYNIIIGILVQLAIKKEIINITNFCNSLKEQGLHFAIYGNPTDENNIYSYLGDISTECIEEQIPNITILIQFPDYQLKGFYRLNEYREEVKYKANTNLEDAIQLKKIPKDIRKKVLQEEVERVFNFDWENFLYQNNETKDVLINQTTEQEQNAKTREISIETRINFPTDLKNQILQRAQNQCENKNCKNPDSFRDKNGDIFLEIHHIIPYSECKIHSFDNCVALCPNCHRQVHFGNPSDIQLPHKS